ncbi:MAG: hypothetical protein GY832_32085 [Chloroflexi bacterium]|nr:hypothetical protein [Chloroflexota bacterium]
MTNTYTKPVEERTKDCPDCGQKMDWEECPMCDGDGQSPGEWVGPCEQCDGDGGSWFCDTCCEKEAQAREVHANG